MGVTGLTIREYGEQLQHYYRHDRNVDWYQLFEVQGYHHVQAAGRWQLMHDWLTVNVHEQHYVWHGNHFWFEYSEDAVLFALMWS